MRRSSKYFHLKYVVEGMRPGQAFYEPMAAFDVEDIAKGYAETCYNHKQGIGGIAAEFKYRVAERTKAKGSNYGFKTIATYPVVKS